MLGWTAPYSIECARPRRCNNAAKRSRPNDDYQDWFGHVQGGVPGHVFQLHGVDENEQPVLRRQLQRRAVEKFFAKPPSARVGIAACGASHHWARVLCGFGHEGVLIQPQYIQPDVKRGAGMRQSLASPPPRACPRESQGAPADARAVAAFDDSAGCAGAGARDARHADGPARGGEWQVARDRGAADGLPSARSDQPGPGDDPRHRADRRGQLCPQEPALAKAGVADAKALRAGRHFAAWIGITPREDSTAGKHRPGRISRAGDEDLRRLLVLGATAVIQRAKRGRVSPWLLGLLARKPKKLAAVALANKMARIVARIVWAMRDLPVSAGGLN